MGEQPSWQDVLDLISQLNESDYESASVQVGDVSIRLSKNDAVFDAPTTAGRVGAQPRIETGFDTPTASATQPAAAAIPTAAPAAALGDTIDAPMIGVFYRRPSPGAAPFVEPGQRVEADTTIGIIEIMKLMNPIVAGKAGVITDFLVTDADAVEFGQPLATIDTSA
ncbi:MAG: acetyl-CoA carboxylase biotin carboxyl carrier protein [Aurantimicrobium sp.]|nr:acetyl-CoA carboxylase biotin carboxyl carrier protein [Aurantimicrobium sp.]